MKGQTWEGGIRVPMIARRPGRIPAGRTTAAPGIVMDVFATTLAAAGVSPPGDRVFDGQDLTPVLCGGAPSPHEALFSYRADKLHSVRSGRWKLHLSPPGTGREKIWKPDEPWVDPRRPDGVRILAPFEQPHPSLFPGSREGDAVTGEALFDLEADRAETRNVAAAHPDEVARLRTLADRFRAGLGR
jgi:arylsulfatase A-like enzyme